MGRRGVFGAAAVLLAACSSAGEGPLCVPGAAAACACFDGRSGAQVCREDGAGFAPCQCSGDDGGAFAVVTPGPEPAPAASENDSGSAPEATPDAAENDSGSDSEPSPDAAENDSGPSPEPSPDDAENDSGSALEPSPDHAGDDSGSAPEPAPDVAEDDSGSGPDDDAGNDSGSAPEPAPDVAEDDSGSAPEPTPDAAENDSGSAPEPVQPEPVPPEPVAEPEPEPEPTDDPCYGVQSVVYVVSTEKVLLRFRPDLLTFETVGFLDCPGAGGAFPFSMGVDVAGTAWVLYQAPGGTKGTIFQVSTVDASCLGTVYVPGQKGFDFFGMGFTADGPASPTETLYLAGGPFSGLGTTTQTLGKLTFPGLMVSTVGKLGAGPGIPELTGTRDGELWGFFPQTSPPSIRQIDKTTGGILKTYTLPAADFSGNDLSWAFAHWGGSFWVFIKKDFDASTKVWEVVKDTGAATLALPSTGYSIVGAGVSICAPTE